MNNVVKMNLNNVTNAKAFVNIVTKYDCKVTIKSGEYTVNGRSLLGIFSLDLQRDVTVTFKDVSNTDLACLLNELRVAAILKS